MKFKIGVNDLDILLYICYYNPIITADSSFPT